MKYRPDIDGLRAIAVLPVVAFHAKTSAFPGGFIGVDIFFVISGYLIGSMVLRDVQAREFSILSFYERRIRRIIPALAAKRYAEHTRLWVGYAVGLLGYVSGLVASSVFDLPTGAMIVVTLLLALLLAVVVAETLPAARPSISPGVK